MVVWLIDLPPLLNRIVKAIQRNTPRRRRCLLRRVDVFQPLPTPGAGGG